MSLHAHSLVANVLPFIVSSKVITQDISSLNKDSNSSEHYIPREPARDGTTGITGPSVCA